MGIQSTKELEDALWYFTYGVQRELKWRALYRVFEDFPGLLTLRFEPEEDISSSSMYVECITVSCDPKEVRALLNALNNFNKEQISEGQENKKLEVDEILEAYDVTDPSRCEEMVDDLDLTSYLDDVVCAYDARPTDVYKSYKHLSFSRFECYDNKLNERQYIEGLLADISALHWDAQQLQYKLDITDKFREEERDDRS